MTMQGHMLRSQVSTSSKWLTSPSATSLQSRPKMLLLNFMGHIVPFLREHHIRRTHIMKVTISRRFDESRLFQYHQSTRVVHFAQATCLPGKEKILLILDFTPFQAAKCLSQHLDKLAQRFHTRYDVAWITRYLIFLNKARSNPRPNFKPGFIPCTSSTYGQRTLILHAISYTLYKGGCIPDQMFKMMSVIFITSDPTLFS